MRGLLPSVWLLGAALYTALTLFLSRPVIEDWPLPPHVNETAVAKQPAKSARLMFKDEALAELAAAEPATAVKFQPKAAWHNEWAQIAGYTTVGRLRPSATSPVLFAYSVGRPLRVISREGGFARVQDLGSGQLGWVRETSLAPFIGGYRQREERVAEPVVAAAEPAATMAAVEPAATMSEPESVAVVTPVAVNAVAPAAVKKAQHPRNPAIAAKPRKDTVAAAEPAPRGLFRRKRNQIQQVALGSDNSGVAAIMQRALGRF
jgi:hypothetical protein